MYMKRRFWTLSCLICAICSLVTVSCNDGETYADMKEKERDAINDFLDDNPFVGKINVITEAEFLKDTVTNLERNEFVEFGKTGIYMQIISRGKGKTMEEMVMESGDSSITKVLLCKFLEYDIEAGDTICENLYYPNIVDKMQVKYDHRGRSYTASFTSGQMMSYYGSSAVPSGWMKPLDFIKLSRSVGERASVRLIVPHSSGTSNASGYVLPMYYEISYQLGL